MRNRFNHEFHTNSRKIARNQTAENEIVHAFGRRSDVIIDASMPAAIRDSGKMWTKDDTLADTKFTIPDRCYAGARMSVT